MGKKFRKCHVCRSNKEMTKHHVIPRIFYQFLPPEQQYLGNIIARICRDCHDEYEEKFAKKYIYELYQKYQLAPTQEDLDLLQLYNFITIFTTTEKDRVKKNKFARIKNFIMEKAHTLDKGQLIHLQQTKLKHYNAYHQIMSFKLMQLVTDYDEFRYEWMDNFDQFVINYKKEKRNASKT
jgi:hypothetical protein